jgi:hypothetical protein
MAAVREWLGKHVPVAVDTHMRMVLSVWAVPRSYKEDSWGNQVRSVRESVKKDQLEGSCHSERT